MAKVKNFLLGLLVTIPIIGAVMFFSYVEDALIYIKGTKVDLCDPLSSMSEKAMIEGEIDFVYGPFCTLEESSTRYGVKMSSTETDFFIVGNVERGEGFAVLSSSSKSMRDRLTAASDDWLDYMTSEDKDAVPPEVSISFTGKLTKQYNDSDYDTYGNTA